jgi:hypothetical protein
VPFSRAAQYVLVGLGMNYSPMISLKSKYIFKVSSYR